STATRLANIADVPPFHYALPLRIGGADLVAIPQRDKAQPDMRMTGTMDHSAGIDFPQLFELTMEVSGPAGAMLESLADTNDPEMLRRLAGGFAERGGIEGGVLTSLGVAYDKQAAVGRLTIEGIAAPSFRWENGRLVVDMDAAAEEPTFNPDRARLDW